MQIPAPDGVLLLCQLLFTSFPLNCGIYSLNFFFFFLFEFPGWKIQQETQAHWYRSSGKNSVLIFGRLTTIFLKYNSTRGSLYE